MTELPEGFDSTRHALRNSHGPCPDSECRGALNRIGTAHGSDVYRCGECGIETTTTAMGS